MSLHSLIQRELKLRARAGQVMSELRASGGDWQTAWRDHPIAKEYRALLKESWAETLPKAQETK
jgi:hypothetical protein